MATPVAPRAVEVDFVVELTRAALLRGLKHAGCDSLHTMLNMKNIAQHTKLLTPESEKLTGTALRALLAPVPLPSLMKVEIAKASLEQVEGKMATRAAKRKAEAKAAAAAEEASLREMGAKRAAKRAAIAARPAKTVRLVENTGCVRYY